MKQNSSAHSLKPGGSEVFVLQVLEANHWVDVHTRRGALTSVESAKRIYRRMCKENPGKADPVCGMRVIMCHFTHYGQLPNTKLSGGGPLSNKTTEAESRRPLE